MTKKFSALLLTFVLCLSLCACGSASPGGGSPAGNTKETLLEDAVSCNSGAIFSAYTDNAVAASDTYVGTVCTVTGYVSGIAEDHILLVPLNAPLNPLTGINQVTVKAHLPAEEIRQVHKNEVLQIVGEISALASGVDIIMEVAYYLDDTVSFTAEVENFLYNSGYHVMVLAGESELYDGSTSLVSTRYEYTVGAAEQLENLTEATFGDAAVAEGDSATFTAKINYTNTSYPSGMKGMMYVLNFKADEILSVSDLQKYEMSVEEAAELFSDKEGAAYFSDRLAGYNTIPGEDFSGFLTLKTKWEVSYQTAAGISGSCGMTFESDGRIKEAGYDYSNGLTWAIESGRVVLNGRFAGSYEIKDIGGGYYLFASEGTMLLLH